MQPSNISYSKRKLKKLHTHTHTRCERDAPANSLIMRHFDCWSQVFLLYMSRRSQVGRRPRFWTVLCILRAEMPERERKKKKCFLVSQNLQAAGGKQMISLPSLFFFLLCSTLHDVTGTNLSPASWHFVWIRQKSNSHAGLRETSVIMSHNPGNIDGAISFAANVVSRASEVNEESFILSCQSTVCWLSFASVGGDGRGERASVFLLLSAKCTYCSLTAKKKRQLILDQATISRWELFDFYSKEKKAKSDLIHRAGCLSEYIIYCTSLFFFF